MACSNYCTQADLKDLSSPNIAVSGAAGEKFARVVLAHEMGLKAYSFTRMSNNKGLDLAMHNPSQSLVVVEVKTTLSTSATAVTKSFDQRLGRGYGGKQGSVQWLSGVGQGALGQGKHADGVIRSSLAHPESVPVLGVHIDARNQVANIYIRADQDAFEWTEVASGIPLHHYVR